MKTRNLAEAKATLSQLIAEIRDGREPEIAIALNGKPVAKLVPFGRRPRRVLGLDAGLFVLPDDFDAPNASVAALFESDSA